MESEINIADSDGLQKYFPLFLLKSKDFEICNVFTCVKINFNNLYGMASITDWNFNKTSSSFYRRKTLYLTLDLIINYFKTLKIKMLPQIIFESQKNFNSIDQINHDDDNLNIGKWTTEENLKYAIFLF